MYLSSDEARSDVVLAGAATVFGGVLIQLLLTAPGIPTAGLGADLLTLVVWFVLSGLVPVLLARYRDDVPEAFGLRRDVGVDVVPALLLALPVVVLGVVRGLLVDGSIAVALLGGPGRALLGSPVVGPVGGTVVATVLSLLGVLVLTTGAWLLFGFLVTRAAPAFARSGDERSATEVLRTFAVAATGVALVLGGVGALTGGRGPVTLLLNVLALAAVVLVADRLVPAGAIVSRVAVIVPLVVVVVAHVIAGGGLFRGNLLIGLADAAFAGGVVVVFAVLAQQRTSATLVPIVLAVHWWPTCLTPLPFTAC